MHRIATLLLTVALTDASAQDVAGRWSGTFSRGGDSIDVAITLAHDPGGYRGWLDSDALQVAHVPLDAITVDGGHVRFELRGDSSTTTAEGDLADAGFSGTLRDASAPGEFHLLRAPAPARTVNEREVHFASRGARLAGTLLTPPAPAGGRAPAIVFLHGSGPEGRWANRYLATRFTERGYYALIYDKRGVAESTGDWRSAGFDGLADDAAAAIAWLRAQPGVDPRRVGLYGHSQGGTIAPVVAARAAGLRFVIASAAGGLDPAQIERYSVGNSIGLAELAPAERADAQRYVDALVDVGYHGADRARLDELCARYRKRDWYFDAPPADDWYWAFSRMIAPYRPDRYWRRVRAPVLLVYGERDQRVPPVESATAIRSALAAGGNANVTVRMLPGADHTFVLRAPDTSNAWPHHVPGYAPLLIDWADQQR